MAAARLRGTVWERSSLAQAAYRESLALGRGVGALGITPDTLTYASLVLAAAAGVAAGIGSLALAAALVVASGLCDVLDGVVARSTGRSTAFGALLDSTVDRLSDGLPLVGLTVFYAGSGPAAVVPACAIIASLSVSYVRARAEGLGVKLPPLFMRRAERVVLLTVSLLLSAVPLSAPVPAPLLLLGVALIALFSFAGVVGALREARALLGAAEQDRPRPAPSSADRPAEGRS